MSTLEETYPKGSRVDAVVSRVEAFGIFVKVAGERGTRAVTGFIRPRDWSWTRRIFDITETIEPGLEISAQVIGHRGSQKLELSRRLALPDPFPAFLEKHRVGNDVVGRVSLVAQNETGVMLALDEGVEGYVPRSEIPDSQEEGFGLYVQDHVAARIIGFQDKQVRLSIKDCLRAREQKKETASEAATLGFHPSLGLGLENIRLNLQFDEIEEPEIDPAVRERVRRVLIVEDSDNVSESLSMVFEHFGFECETTREIDDALERFLTRHFDLLLLDMNLPSANGVELLDRIPKDGTADHATWIFVLTATRAVEWEAVVRSKGDRVACFFQKPTSVIRLFEQLSRLAHDEPVQDDRAAGAGLDADTGFDVAARVSNRNRHQANERICGVLDDLRRETRASHAFVLSYHPGPSFDLIAGEFPELTRDVQQEIEISPIGDVLRQRRYFHAADVSRQPDRFKHLVSVVETGSFAGIALERADQADYGLFLIGRRPGQLQGASEARLLSAARLIGHEIAEQRFNQVITQNQSLLLTGFLADSLLHEVKNELQALDDYAAVQLLFGKKHKDDLRKLEDRLLVEFKRSILGIQAVSKRLGELTVLFRNLAGQPAEEDIDVNNLIELLCETVKPFADGQNVFLETDLDPDLPGLRMSPKLFEQPLLNLMINGVEQVATSGGRRRLRIATRFEPGEERPVRIFVADNGRGIHYVHWEKIFDLFFTTKVRGTGLGLYISKFFVEQLGGRLRLHSSLMFSGTEFVIELPAA